jgi:hypothetical protein
VSRNANDVVAMLSGGVHSVEVKHRLHGEARNSVQRFDTSSGNLFRNHLRNLLRNSCGAKRFQATRRKAWFRPGVTANGYGAHAAMCDAVTPAY